MKHELTSEMIRWLDKEWHDKVGATFTPLLIVNFMYEFGHKKSGIPDSLPVEEARRLVNEWLGLRLYDEYNL